MEIDSIKRARFVTFLDSIIWAIIRTRLFNQIRPKLWHSTVYLLEGKTKHSEFNLSTIVFARKEYAAYVSKLIYVEEPKIKFLGNLAFSDIRSLAENTTHDLILIEANESFSGFLLDNGFFVLPQINFTLDISDSMAAILSRVDRAKRRHIRRLVQATYTYEITKDPVKLRSFYYEMYLPHMLAKHGKSARPVSFSVCRKFFAKGFLVLIKLQHEYVSGMILVANYDELYQPIIGVKNIDKDITLGTYATYYYATILGKKKGYNCIDFGDAPPFVLDGLFQYKKGWGMRIRPPKNPGAQVFGIRFSNLGEAVKDFLLTNPFIFIDGKNLSGLTFLDSFRNTRKYFEINGLSNLLFISSNPHCSDFDFLQLKRVTLGDHDVQTSISLSRLISMCHERDSELLTRAIPKS